MQEKGKVPKGREEGGSVVTELEPDADGSLLQSDNRIRVLRLLLGLIQYVNNSWPIVFNQQLSKLNIVLYI